MNMLQYAQAIDVTGILIMQPFLPPKVAPILFGFLVSGLMTFIVSGISTYNAIGLSGEVMRTWMNAWGASWVVAFPVILFVAPVARWLVGKLVKKPV